MRAHGRTEGDAEALLDHLSLKIEQALGNSVFSFRGETMEEVVGRRLAMTEFTLAVAESCTGGLIAQRLTNVPGSSKYFIEGLVTYSNASKTRLLGVDKKLIKEFGAVSQQVARDMARGVRHKAKTDFGLRSRELPVLTVERMKTSRLGLHAPSLTTRIRSIRS